MDGRFMMKKRSIIPLILTMTCLLETSAMDKSQDMSISYAGVRLIARFEGFRDQIYTCPGGKPTIGFGHVVKDGEVAQFSGKLTEEEGYKLLNSDVVATYVPDVKRLVTVPLNQAQFDALTSFDYNLGAANLGSSTLLKLLNACEYHEASLQFPVWSYSRKVFYRGLLKRRIAEMLIFLDDPHIPQDLAKVEMKAEGKTVIQVYQELPQTLKDEAESIYVANKANWR
jgi:lysozyme